MFDNNKLMTQSQVNLWECYVYVLLIVRMGAQRTVLGQWEACVEEQGRKEIEENMTKVRMKLTLSSD